MPYLQTCEACGAHLNPGEVCICQRGKSHSEYIQDKILSVEKRIAKIERILQEKTPVFHALMRKRGEERRIG
jgi:hypothetical protein